MKLTIFGLVIVISFLENVCQGAPIAEDDTPRNLLQKKPRCMSSLFGGLFDFDSPTLPDIPSMGNFGGGLQGGMMSPNGFGNTAGFGTSLGVPSRYTPGLGQASSTLQNAHGLEDQLAGAQAQLNSQLAGVPSSGIPLSPGFLRGGSDLSYQRSSYLPPPPTILRSPYFN